MKALKIIAFIIGFVMIFFGMGGFLSSFATAATDKSGMMVSSVPINQVNGIAVDSIGQIYIGDGQSSCIQVFSNTGQFMYGFAFATGGAGYFAFGIDDEDIIHIVTARTESYFQYMNGKCIDSESIDYSRQEQLEEDYNMRRDNQYSSQDKKYFVSSRNQITIHDLSSKTEERVELDTPFWPLSIFTYWLINAVGIGLWFWSFAWKLVKSTKSFYKIKS